MTPEFTAGFNAGLEAAKKIVSEPNGCDCDACLESDMEANVRVKRISALTVPSDLVAVPREPSEDMASAAIAALGTQAAWTWPDQCKAIYRAMISATEPRG